jgi:hypothetical protein
MPAPAATPAPAAFPAADPQLASKVFGPGMSGGPHQLLNTTKASLEYKFDNVGQSGIGKVEIYVTKDNGASWELLGEDADRRSPADVNLPGEGVFGIRLVVTNGHGFGGRPPAHGEAPTSTIEVDMTPPIVELHEVEPVAKDGRLEIRWKASDKNLGNDPVNLFYRVRPDAAWMPMAKRLKNDGVYLWTFPRESGNRFYVKIEVADMAGNVTRAECANPVILDMSEPRANVVGITGVQARPSGHGEE